MTLKDLKAQSHALEPTVMVGKAGITDQTIAEIKAQLKKKRLIKVKLLKSAREEMKQQASSLATQTESTLVRQIGGIVILYKERL
jgi:RNA-binding protein